MKESGLLKSPGVLVAEPRYATEAELRLFHKPEYLEFVSRVSKVGGTFLDSGDTPGFRGCYEASALAAGASLTAVDLVMTDKATYGMNISGGLHHAHPDRASGFCIFNDPAISIAYLRKQYGVRKILYLDVDAHHGDGVMYGFYSDGGVLDIDFHEDGHHLFPGTGFTSEVGEGQGVGMKVNVPLPPFTGDELYLPLFREIVPRAVKEFHPEVLLLQCGADSHANDLLAHLQLTTKSYLEIVNAVRELASTVGGKLVVFGGGGYNQANVARAWTLVAAALLQTKLPELTPESWRKLFEALVGEDAPERMSSENEERRELSSRVDKSQLQDSLKDLKKRIPLLSQPNT